MKATPFWKHLLKATALHAAAGGIVVGLAVALVVVAYVGLLAWAVVTGSREAETFQLAGMMLETTVTASVVVVAVLFPVTALASLVCGRLLKWPRVAQIPVSAGLLFAAVLGLVDLAIQAVQPGETVSWRLVFVTWLALLPALTVYWWVVQVPRLLSRIVAYFHIQRTGF